MTRYQPFLSPVSQSVWLLGGCVGGKCGQCFAHFCLGSCRQTGEPRSVSPLSTSSSVFWLSLQGGRGMVGCDRQRERLLGLWGRCCHVDTWLESVSSCDGLAEHCSHRSAIGTCSQWHKGWEGSLSRKVLYGRKPGHTCVTPGQVVGFPLCRVPA